MKPYKSPFTVLGKAYSWFAPSQWETALLCNDVSHWLDASLESALLGPLSWEITGKEILLCRMSGMQRFDFFHSSLFWPKHRINQWLEQPLKLDAVIVNPSPPGQNGHHFADDFFRCIFVNEQFCVLIIISLKVVSNDPIGNNSALV